MIIQIAYQVTDYGPELNGSILMPMKDSRVGVIYKMVEAHGEFRHKCLNTNFSKTFVAAYCKPKPIRRDETCGN